ncbi:hypothetical protein [Blastococcus sp. SYSU D00820]
MPDRPALTRRIALLAAAVLAVGLGPAAGVAAAAPAGTVTLTECTEGAFRQAVRDAPDGGEVAITCDGTILLTPEGGSTVIVEKTLTISGTGADVTIDGGERTSLFVVQSGPDVQTVEDLPTLTLRDLTLTRGFSTDQGHPGGGAVWSLANLVAERVTFDDNHAYNRGGAILADGHGSLTVVDSTFTGNTVTCPTESSGGGAIAVRQKQQTTITGSTFTGNAALGMAAGGAVLAYVSNLGSGLALEPPPVPLQPHLLGGPLVITGSTFTANAVYVLGLPRLDRVYGGGAIAALDHPLTLSGSRVEGNYVGETYVGYGAGVLAASIRDTETTVVDSEIVGNVLQEQFGGLPVSGFGGGLALLGTRATVDETLVGSNTALFGGGLWTRAGSVTVQNSDVDDNTAGAAYPGDETFGGGVATHGPLTLTNVQMIGNAGGTCRVLGATPRGEVVTDGGRNDVDGAGSCFRLPVPATPPAATGGLTAPAGPTDTGAPTTLSGSGFAPGARITLVGYPLSGTAPAVAAGTAAATPPPAPVDLGAVPADATGGFTAAPVLPAAGVWQLVALGLQPDGGTAVLSALVVVTAPGVPVLPVVTGEPAGATVPAGAPVTLTAAAVGSPAPAVRWQVSRDGGATWTDVAGATATTLTTSADGGTTLYRAVFTNAAGSVPTTPATVTGTVAGGPPSGAGPGGTATAGPGGAASRATGGPTAAGLALTGVDALPVAGAGAALVLGGVLLVLAGRRRRVSRGR